jgi:hypothetical protein
MGVLKVLAIIFLIFLLVVAGLGVYFYYFYTFKTLRICIGNENQNLMIPCASKDICIKVFKNMSNIDETLEIFPNELKLKINSALDISFSCENSTCKMKKMSSLSDITNLEKCNPSEREIKYDIKGKEGIAILKILRDKKII